MKIALYVFLNLIVTTAYAKSYTFPGGEITLRNYSNISADRIAVQYVTTVQCGFLFDNETYECCRQAFKMKANEDTYKVPSKRMNCSKSLQKSSSAQIEVTVDGKASTGISKFIGGQVPFQLALYNRPSIDSITITYSPNSLPPNNGFGKRYAHSVLFQLPTENANVSNFLGKRGIGIVEVLYEVKPQLKFPYYDQSSLMIAEDLGENPDIRYSLYMSVPTNDQDYVYEESLDAKINDPIPESFKNFTIP